MGERRPSGHGGWRFAPRVGGRGGVVGGWGGGLFVARVDVVHVVLVMDVRRMSGGSAGWGGSGEGKGWPRGGGVGGGCCRPYSSEGHSFVVLSVGQGRRGLPVRAPLNPGCLQAPAAAAVLLLTTQRVVVCGTGLVLGEGGHLQRREAVRGWARRARAGVTHNGGAHQLNCRHPHNQILHHQQRPHKKEQNNKFSPRVSAADRPYKNNTTKQK